MQKIEYFAGQASSEPVRHFALLYSIHPSMSTLTKLIGSGAMTLLLYFALSDVLFFLPFNLIRNQGYSATLAGAAFLPFTLNWEGRRAGPVGAAKRMTARPRSGSSP